MDSRRSSALSALALFVALTVLATVIDGSRPGTEPGVLPWVLQVLGYLCALAGGVLLMRVEGDGPGWGSTNRRAGLVVLVALVVLVLLDALTGEDAGVNIGAGLVRLLGLGAIVAVTVQVDVAARSPHRRP